MSSEVLYDIYPRNSASCYRDISTYVTITAAITIARSGSNLDVHQQMNGKWKNGICAKQHGIHLYRKVKFVGKWLDLESLLSKMGEKHHIFYLICTSQL